MSQPNPLPTADLPIRIGAMFLHPIKSCAGVAVDEALLIETGLELDRAWMVVDEGGRMLTQRELPRMALIRPVLRSSDLVLRAPGMLALHVQLDNVEAPTRVQVWRDIVKAYDMGALAAQWFSDFLGCRVRLARFDPDERRECDPAWTGTTPAQTAFADGYPLLVVGAASLDALNQRLAGRGRATVGIERFRPNLLIEGLQPHDEDLLDEISFETEEGGVRLRLVKPCVRCTIPDIDPATAESGSEPGATLTAYRADARMQGGITFGMNAVIVEGIDCVLRAGLAGRASWRFD